MSRALTHRAMLEAAGECYQHMAGALCDAKVEILELEERNEVTDEKLSAAYTEIRRLRMILATATEVT